MCKKSDKWVVSKEFDEWVREEIKRKEEGLKNLYPWWVDLLVRLFGL